MGRKGKMDNNKTQNELEELESIIGYELYYKVIEHFSGKQLYFPRRLVIEKKREAIRKEYRQGTQFNELANKYGYTTQHIRRIVREPEKTPNNEATGRLVQIFKKVLAIFRRKSGRNLYSADNLI
jgi:Mor family transcriptional regulator